MNKNKPFPRRDILDRQKNAVEVVLELDAETLKVVRGGTLRAAQPMYGVIIVGGDDF